MSRLNLVFILFLLFFALVVKIQAQVFQWPVDAPAITQEYSWYNGIGNLKYHAGIDLHSDWYTPNNYDTPVKATADGWIHKVFGLTFSPGSDNLLRCGGSWEGAPNIDSDGQSYDGYNNHGNGMSVMIKHANGKYSLYSHLDCISSGINPGVWVSRGAVIGTMGNSYGQYRRRCRADNCYSACTNISYGTCDADGFNPHLHFEIKNRGILADQTDDCCIWGYYPDLPDGYGYYDPQVYITPFTSTTISPVPVKIVTDVLRVRTGPGTSYSTLTTVSLNQKFVAFAKSGDWYQIYLPHANSKTSGWIAGRYGGETLAIEDPSAPQVEVLDDGIRIRTGPGTSNDVVKTKNYLDTLFLWTGQRFVYFQTSSAEPCYGRPWYRIYLPGNASASDGWSCGYYLPVEDEPYKDQLPVSFTLSQNYPNPFNATTVISYSLRKNADVKLVIYNLHGQKVRILVDEQKPAGEYQITWDGKNDSGEEVASGVYFYRMIAGEFSESKKMVLLR